MMSNYFTHNSLDYCTFHSLSNHFLLYVDHSLVVHAFHISFLLSLFYENHLFTKQFNNSIETHCRHFRWLSARCQDLIGSHFLRLGESRAYSSHRSSAQVCVLERNRHTRVSRNRRVILHSSHRHWTHPASSRTQGKDRR